MAEGRGRARVLCSLCSHLYESLGGKVRLETGGEVSLESQVKAPEALIGTSRLK